MFDIGFWELVLVGLVALIVVGPERLPEVARFLAVWIRKAQQSVRSLRKEIEDEIHADELRRTLAENLQAQEIQSLVQEAKSSFKAPESVAHAPPAAASIDLSKSSHHSD